MRASVRGRRRRISNLRVETLEIRALLALPPMVTVPLNEDLDQFGDQVVTVMGFESADGTSATGAGFGIFDTGASAITFSADDASIFEFYENPLPIKVPGGAEAEGIGGVITGDVSEPVTIVADGLHASELTFDNDGFPEFNFDFGGAARTPGIQAFIGTEFGSPALPTITGTPLLKKSELNPNGLAAKIDMLGQVLDFSDIMPGLVLPFPDVHFIDPTNASLDAQDGITEPIVIDLQPYGPDNSDDPGDEITSAPNVTIANVSASVGAESPVTISNQSFLFDTGAQISVISTAMAEALGLDLSNPETTITVQGVGGSEDVAGFTLAKLDMPRRDGGMLEFTEIPVYVLDVAPDIDGILGMNAFNTASQFLFNPHDPAGASLTITFLTDPDRGDPGGGGDDGIGFGDLLLNSGIAFGGAIHGRGLPSFKPRDIRSTTSVSVSSSSNSSVFGAELTFTATVTSAGGTPSGDVVFLDNGAPLAPAVVLDTAGVAELVTHGLGVGSHEITARYLGNDQFSLSDSESFDQEITRPHLTISPSATPQAPVLGQSVRLTSQLAAVEDTTAKPAGTLRFKEGAKVLGQYAVVAAGDFFADVPDFAVGTRSITIEFESTNEFLPTSVTHVLSVGKATPGLNLAADDTSLDEGQGVTLTATITIGAGLPAPAGEVEFVDGTKSLGRRAVDPASGLATLPVSDLPVGSHNITATYLGDDNYKQSPPSAITITVNAGSGGGGLPAATATTLTTSLSSVVFGQSFSLIATVAGMSNSSHDQVVFRDGPSILGTALLAGGVARLDGITLASAGSHTLSASFAGNSQFAPSKSNDVIELVRQAATTTIVTIAPARGKRIAAKKRFATVAIAPVAPGAGTPTGSVKIRIGRSTKFVQLSNGGATFAISARDAQARSAVVVSYLGDGNFMGSKSARLTAKHIARRVAVR